MANHRILTQPNQKAKNNNNKKKKKKSAFGSIIKYVIIIAIAFLSAIYVGGSLYITSLQPIKNFSELKPNIVTKIYSADNEVIKTFTGFKSKNVNFKNIPTDLKNAIIATEDKSFYEHKGFDPFGLARSIIMNIMSGRVVQGASTITQQLARILFLDNEKTYNRKLKELIIAARIEKSVSKDKILEMYLNNVYLGSSAYGIGAAAEVYFGKSLNELTLAEIALIAGLPQAPSVYSPFNKPELALKRRNHVLNRMYKMGYINSEQLEKAKQEKLILNQNPDVNFYHKAGYFIDYVIDELETLGFSEQEISQGGYKIKTTLNYQAQRAAENAILKNLAAWGLTQPQQQGAAFSFNPNTGEIYVYVGGKNYGQSQFDRVKFAARPPGSSFKPFVYAAAIEKGYDPNELIDDTPFTSYDKKWTPKNYGNKYRGKIPLYKALAVSSNVVAARLIQDIGVKPVINICHSLGITTHLEHDLTIALGSNDVKLYEMVIAYGAFANDGFKVKPYAVEQIETSTGKVIYKAQKRHCLKVLDSRTAAILTAMMETVIKNGTGRAADIGKPAAAKTGTTDNYKDAWFVGYTPNVVTGVWVGKDDNSDMKVALTGGTVPALIWRDIMKIATKKFGNEEFLYPTVELGKPGYSHNNSNTAEELPNLKGEEGGEEELVVPPLPEETEQEPSMNETINKRTAPIPMGAVLPTVKSPQQRNNDKIPVRDELIPPTTAPIPQ